ncbi:GtrA family protein [Actinoplanes sp. NPDC026619]|uniref:GtrA family protein n=1 Tax=Actinoplanes sp. NPDC026619 TaxID=3155798 RepID=UPI0033DD9A81
MTIKWLPFNLVNVIGAPVSILAPSAVTQNSSGAGAMDVFRVHRRHVVRFALVGAFCFGMQYAVMTVLARIGVDLSLSNAAGFFLSAQVNFVLSSVFTWGGGEGPGSGLSWGGLSWLRWASYNSTALLGLAVNTVVFSAVHRPLGVPLGTLAGGGASAVFTYLVCNFLVFRQRRAPLASTVEAEVAA